MMGTDLSHCSRYVPVGARQSWLVGVVMGMPLQWHRRHAIMLAGQLPDNTDDALIVIQAMKDLVESYLMAVPDAAGAPADNVLPFAGKG